MKKEYLELLDNPFELHNVEYKRSMSWNEHIIKAKITKIILALSNIQNGGYLILGIEEDKMLISSQI